MFDTVLFIKIRHENSNTCLSFAEFLEANVQRSIRSRLLFPYILYGRKYWRELNLAVGAIVKILVDLNLAVW